MSVELRLTMADHDELEGEHGPGVQMAMRILVRMAGIVVAKAELAQSKSIQARMRSLYSFSESPPLAVLSGEAMGGISLCDWNG